MVEKIKKLDKKKLRYILLAVVFPVILAGIFKVQIKQIGLIFFGVTIDKTIDLAKKDADFSMLILGIGGEAHEGPDLTDTIIYAHVSIDKKRADLVSIPRDLWINSAKSKINAIYTFGKEEGMGIEKVRIAAEEVVGQKIDYVLIIDFQGFVSLIDHIGGIDVNIEKSFEDMEYPIAGMEEDLCGNSEDDLKLLATASSQLEAFPCRYQTIKFSRGKQLMDGANALTFVRSRHGTNGEGSDFARSKRQQLIIDSLRKKVLSLEILLNPVKVIGIYNIIQGNIHTDIKTEKIDDFIKLANELKDGVIRSYVIDDGDEYQDREGLLVNPPINKDVNFQWVLAPRIRINDFSEIHEFINCVNSGSLCLVTKTGIVTPVPTTFQELNSTPGK